MYPVSDAFLRAVRSNTRKYFWTGTIVTKGGMTYEFGAKEIVKGSGYISRQCCGSTEIELGTVYALIAFVVIYYLTGVMCAFADHTLSSEVGFRGICRKVLIFLLVGMANILDVSVIGNGSVLRTAVIFFYISNEGVSLLENAGHLGLPIPQKMKDVLEQLHDRGEGSDGE